MWSRRLTSILLAVLFTAAALHALVTASLATSWVRGGPGKGAYAFTVGFAIFTTISLAAASAAYLTRRRLAKLDVGFIIPMLFFASLWLAFAIAPVVNMQLF